VDGDANAGAAVDGLWPGERPRVVRRRPQASSMHRYLLDADDDLAREFDMRTRIAARTGTTARVLLAGLGECDLGPAFGALGQGFGLLVLDGLIAFEVAVGDRIATELVGAGDLITPARDRSDAMLDCCAAYRVLAPAQLALLDAEFAARVRPWPQLVHALLRRAGRRTAEVDEMRAIACHPRLEVRLDLLFWHLAARWGRVEPTGIRLTLPLTHRLLGQLVAAERPSISHALARLSSAGLVTGSAGDWHLHGSAQAHLSSLVDRDAHAHGHGHRAASN
jgi:CRP/FNR family cyclic AMP-dependent transcriptional regulator